MFTIKDIMPKSLFGRFLLIILIPTVIVQVVGAYMFYQRHWTSVTRNMASALAGEISTALYLIEAAPVEESHNIINQIKKNQGLTITFLEGSRLSNPDQVYLDKYDMLNAELSRLMSYPFTIFENIEKQTILIEIKTPEKLYRIKAPLKRLNNPTTYIFNLWMAGTGLIVLIISLIFMNNQIRPIAKLAEAAEKFGKGEEMPNFKARGATEVRQAAAAFMKMKERISRHLTQRTDMLSGVSHDLKTPLTRMKLELNMMPQNEHTKELLIDIHEMEKMLQSYLNFAKGQESEKKKDVHLNDLLTKIYNAYRKQKKKFSLDIKESMVLHIREQSVRRAIVNILENSFRFAKNVAMTLEKHGNYAVVIIDDNGPGIPADKREDVFRPFYRIDSSRNKETGGVGLGLSIARDAIISHGGQIILSESPMGGLRSTIKLPL